ncbi:uncharacterized protein RJT21DRAFT_13645 [Scheffersomyces amazonensis]|uniref:uncharacterized protein n=1 Tax=Scheffersomyces amazonensis TaxID=1078765 RepID=UPI00315DFF8F
MVSTMNDSTSSNTSRRDEVMTTSTDRNSSSSSISPNQSLGSTISEIPPPVPLQSVVEEPHPEREQKALPSSRYIMDNSWSNVFATAKEMCRMSIILENKGSVARDHLANERTFLSWIRTGTNLVAFGIGFLQIYSLDIKANSIVVDQNTGQSQNLTNDTHKMYQALTKPISSICVILGILSCIFGLTRYFQVQFLLIRNYYPATRLLLVILILVNLAMLILLLILDAKVTAHS